MIDKSMNEVDAIKASEEMAREYCISIKQTDLNLMASDQRTKLFETAITGYQDKLRQIQALEVEIPF